MSAKQFQFIKAIQDALGVSSMELFTFSAMILAILLFITLGRKKVKSRKLGNTAFGNGDNNSVTTTEDGLKASLTIKISPFQLTEAEFDLLAKIIFHSNDSQTGSEEILTTKRSFNEAYDHYHDRLIKQNKVEESYEILQTRKTLKNKLFPDQED